MVYVLGDRESAYPWWTEYVFTFLSYMTGRTPRPADTEAARHLWGRLDGGEAYIAAVSPEVGPESVA